jgi:RNA polymerase sigma factor (sigma-70 family)
MYRSDDDLISVPESEFSKLSEAELLRVVVISRRAPSLAARVKPAWKELTARDFDRITGIVQTFRFPGQPGVRIPPDDVPDVVNIAWMRLYRAAGTFKGTVLPEFRAFMNRVVRFACQDHCRRLMNEDRRLAGSLDETVGNDDGDDRPRFEGDIAKGERQAIEDAEADEAARERTEKQRRCVEQAMEELGDEVRRVLEMTQEGLKADRIAEELGVSRDVVYAHRSRGIKRIAKAARECLEDDEP